MSIARDRETFVGACVAAGMTEAVARLTLRDAQTIQRVSVLECNGEATPGDVLRKRAAQRRITQRACAFGFFPSFQGDPRGECTKLRIPGNPGNSFGGDGLYCVPTRRY